MSSALPIDLKALSALRPGETGVVVRLDTEEEASLKFMELGIGPGEPVMFMRRAPLNGPVEIELMGYRLCIRHADAEKIFVTCSPQRSS